ncbi:MAG: hypothetical protein ROO76_16345 [Terriglobia bacterium]|nr:hypothetical protein [Terriglobia bacterium]
MPAWKTFDDQTATALKQRLDENDVSIQALSQPLFEHRDSVVVAPTLQKGAALVITARRKTPVSAVPVLEPTADANPMIESVRPEPAPPESESSLPPVAESVIPIQHQAQLKETESAPSTEQSPAEFIFGPTTWERPEIFEPVPTESRVEHETSGTDPALWDIPSEAIPQPDGNIETEIPWHDAIQSEPPVIETSPVWDDDRHVATGFLGLDDYVEDEEEVARSKRPWWKKIFSD